MLPDKGRTSSGGFNTLLTFREISKPNWILLYGGYNRFTDWWRFGSKLDDMNRNLGRLYLDIFSLGRFSF